MHGYKQRRLPLDEENVLEGLWEQFPQAQRDQVIAHYGRWIAAALDQERTARTGEKNNNIAHDSCSNLR